MHAENMEIAAITPASIANVEFLRVRGAIDSEGTNSKSGRKFLKCFI